MKVLLIGSGGREHTLAWKLAQSEHVKEIICTPGNGGTAREPKCRNLTIEASDIETLVGFAEEQRPDLTVVGPEEPLVDGIVDKWPKGLRIWGPNAAQARLEGSKIYAKRLMRTNNIPTASFIECYSTAAAYEAINQFPNGRCVVKADGLAGGKGAIPCHNDEEARAAVKRLMVDKELPGAGEQVVVEEYLEGWETSLLVLCAGGEIIPLETAQDYKSISDDNTGPNTGGMGSYSPVERFNDTLLKQTLNKVARRIALFEKFQGVLYIGLMITEEGPMVLEFNVRFGDPETQAILPRLKTDLFEILYEGAGGKFPTTKLDWANDVCVTVVMAAEGYPGKPRTGDIIHGLDQVSESALIFHAGTKRDESGNVITTGGRVLNVGALAPTREEAKKQSYEDVSRISWLGAYHRSNIAV